MNLSGRRAAGVVDRDDVFAIGDRVGGEVVGDWRELAVERGADDAASRHHPSNRQFPDRDAILVALIDRASRNPSACEAAAVASEPGVARVRAMTTPTCALRPEHRSEYRILFERSQANLVAPARPHQSGLRAFRSSAMPSLISRSRAEGRRRSTACKTRKPSGSRCTGPSRSFPLRRVPVGTGHRHRRSARRPLDRNR